MVLPPTAARGGALDHQVLDNLVPPGGDFRQCFVQLLRRERCFKRKGLHYKLIAPVCGKADCPGDKFPDGFELLRGGRLDNYVGDATKYVISKASCRVIVTAPAAGDARGARAPSAASSPP